MSKISTLDIIVPVQNEEKNIQPLVDRIDKTFESKRKFYRIIFILDKSIDKTEEEITKLEKTYPIILQKKQGIRGKSVSVVEGVALAKSEFVALLDGDLEYPPEALAQMLLKVPEADVVVANRKNHAGGLVRKTGSRTSRFIMSKIFLGQNVDVQSGLKIFRKSLLKYVDLTALKPWSFDFPLLFAALEHGHKIDSVDITYTPRTEGESKVNLWETSRDILWNAAKTVWDANRTHIIEPTSKGSMIGAGVIHKRHEFITHSAIPKEKSALDTFVLWQKVVLIGIIELIVFGLIISPLTTVILFLGALTSVYFIDIIFTLVMVMKSLTHEPEINSTAEELKKINPKKLPIYSILCPLYREGNVLPQFVEAMDKFDYPKNKLDILLLLEENDPETIAAAKKLALPSHYRIVVVPHSMPKTKPKACNYGLSLAKGEYVVIYDAEDKPDADQLKKSYLGFQKVSSKVVCLQAKLNYYNPSHNLLTRLFTAEYSLWFDVVLPGLQSVNTTIPLGGTSNHFKTKALRDIHGWDAFNVTEDCDLGARLFKEGFQTAIIDSVTLEEANSNPKNWLRQRSRWIKGYFQTFLVHNRHPLQFLRTHGKHALLFQLIIGCRTTFTLINPVLWTMTIAYFTLYKFVGPTIASFYPPIVFYMAVISLIFGNFIYLYNYMIGAAKRGQWSIIKYVFLIPLYWFGVSLAAGIAAWQLFTKPHYWEKTIHGFHLTTKVSPKVVMSSKEQKTFFLTRLLNHPVLAKLHSENIGALALIASTFVGNFFNFLYNAFLGRAVNLEEFGTVSLISSLLYVSQIFTSAISRTITHQSGYFLGKHNLSADDFWKNTRRQVLKVSMVITALWLILTPLLKITFHTDSIVPFLLFGPMLVISSVYAVDSGFLSGNLYFFIIAILAVVESVAKFVVTVVLVKVGHPEFLYIALPFSTGLVLLLSWWAISKSISVKPNQNADLSTNIRFPNRFFISSTLFKLSTLTFLGLDVIIVKLFLDPVNAGQYALLSLIGKMVYFFGSLGAQFVLPVVSHHEGAGTDSKKAYNRLLIVTCLASIAGYLTLGVFGNLTTPILWGSKVREIAPYLPLYCLSIVYFTVTSTIVTYHQARRKLIFPVFGFFLASLHGILIVRFHADLTEITNVFLLSGLASLTAILFLQAILPRIEMIFTSPIEKKAKSILIFNWRDTKHVWSGGAEVYIHELAKRWVQMGYTVTLFAGNDRKNPRFEIIDGVTVYRRGGFFLVYVWAALYYFFRFRGKFDIILDCENGIPFFTPLFAFKEKKFLLIHHVHQEIFRKGLPYPAYLVATFLEQVLMPFVYRHVQVLTVSPSSKADILGRRMTKKEPIIIYNGVDLEKMKPGVKAKNPTVLYLGRLKDYKSVPVLLKAARNIINEIPTTKFVIAGDGPEKKKLLKLTKKLDLEKHVSFVGRVTEEEKIALYQKAWVFVNPSLMEGWGITSIEANACGTPVVASNVAGLRDSVKNPHSGILVPYGNYNDFSKAITKILKNRHERNRMEKDSTQWAKKFTWETSSKKLLSLI
jgi:cellulose synthase/poly-beta-1,6-N-acetylglucosamine synthase-like glycosyltransferase/glycosyltransferase involved in cell wall biosynthesis